MRSLVFITTGMLVCANIMAQVSTGLHGDRYIEADKPLKQDQIDQLKKTTTIFFYRESDNWDIKKVEEVFNSVWTVTKIKLVNYRDLNAYENGDYSFFSLAGRVIGGNLESDAPAYLILWMNGVDKKGRKQKIFFARIEMYMNRTFAMAMSTWEGAGRHVYSGHSYASLGVVGSMYTNEVIHNWHPGFLKNYLQLVNKGISELGKKEFYSVTNREKLKTLQTDTLYAPDYLLINKPRKKDTAQYQQESALFAGYHGPYRLLPAAELSDKILNASEDFYYLTIVASWLKRYVTIYNGKTGQIVYNRRRGAGSRMFPTDITNFYYIVKAAK